MKPTWRQQKYTNMQEKFGANHSAFLFRNDHYIPIDACLLTKNKEVQTVLMGIKISLLFLCQTCYRFKPSRPKNKTKDKASCRNCFKSLGIYFAIQAVTTSTHVKRNPSFQENLDGFKIWWIFKETNILRWSFNLIYFQDFYLPSCKNYFSCSKLSSIWFESETFLHFWGSISYVYTSSIQLCKEPIYSPLSHTISSDVVNLKRITCICSRLSP